MRRVIALIGLVLLAGCGGGGGSAPAVGGGNSGPFAGRWSGTYTSTSSDRGTMMLNVGGGASGTITSDVSGMTATMSGTINSGLVTTHYRFSNSATTITAEFDVHKDAVTGHLVGPVPQTFSTGGSGPTLTVDLAPN